MPRAEPGVLEKEGTPVASIVPPIACMGPDTGAGAPLLADRERFEGDWLLEAEGGSEGEGRIGV
jgi:hypothetical protein